METTTEITTRPHRPAPTTEPPDCYGSGRTRVYLRHYANVFNWERVSPRTCFGCSAQRLCLRQQARMRRG